METQVVKYNDSDQMLVLQKQALVHSVEKKMQVHGGPQSFLHKFTQKKIGSPKTSAGDAEAQTDAPHEQSPAQVQELLERLKQQGQEDDGWQNCASTTIALLDYAYEMIESAEQIIERQGDRIEHLEELVTTDELTGLKNRRGFYDHLKSELDRCDRDISKGGVLILIDLDNFKAINDTYGHMAGDTCLRLVGRSLQNEVRVMDVAARLGGDEFVLLLSNAMKDEAAGRAQELAVQLNHMSLAWYGEEIPIRASLGFRTYEKGDKADTVFNDADSDLYSQKRARAMDA